MSTGREVLAPDLTEALTLELSRKRWGSDCSPLKAEVELANGKTVRDVCKGIGITEQTYYRWRQEYGGMKTGQAKRFKGLEKENRHLKQAVAAGGAQGPEEAAEARSDLV